MKFVTTVSSLFLVTLLIHTYTVSSAPHKEKRDTGYAEPKPAGSPDGKVEKPKRDPPPPRTADGYQPPPPQAGAPPPPPSGGRNPPPSSRGGNPPLHSNGNGRRQDGETGKDKDKSDKVQPPRDGYQPPVAQPPPPPPPPPQDDVPAPAEPVDPPKQEDPVDPGYPVIPPPVEANPDDELEPAPVYVGGQESFRK